ncbi:MAG: sugar phosphate isomerase/epimerase [Thermoproteales archaeon]|nr:sugar phosphate isomerase/epimerase [Thermoproteales archaeon]
MFLGVRDIPKSYSFSNLFEMLNELDVKSFELRITRDLKFAEEIEKSFQEYLNLDDVYNFNKLRKKLEEQGYVISALLLANDFMPNILDEQVKYVVLSCEIAEKLGVEVVRINGPMREIDGYTVDMYVELTKKALDIIKNNCKVTLAIENHGVISNRPDYLEKLFSLYDPEFLGLTLDTGNFYWYGHPLSKVYEIIKKFASRVKHTHIKNATVPPNNREKIRKPAQVIMAPLYEGDIDLRQVFKLLREKGYTRDLTIEDESMGRFTPEERKNIIRKDVAFLKEILKSL